MPLIRDFFLAMSNDFEMCAKLQTKLRSIVIIIKNDIDFFFFSWRVFCKVEGCKRGFQKCKNLNLFY
jgi:hypothetical protein